MVSPKDMKLPTMASQVIRERVPPQLEKMARRQREIAEAFFEGRGKDTRMTSSRYMAYTSRLQTMSGASQRYWARGAASSEPIAAAAAKPLLSRAFLRCALALTGVYMAADLTNEGLKAYHHNLRTLELASTATTHATHTNTHTPPRVPAREDWRAVVAERAVFQTLSSLVLPAAALTAVVRHSTKCLADSGSAVVRRWGPLAIGLGIFPMLPYAFDEPVDRLVRAAFDPMYARIEERRAAADAREAREV
ncbi:hypothetical protein KEM52_000290 [Ascosphaera acerosa]|nr:hypothetical protein KEM52_000290 [Ascosphaera acerosa]